MIRADLEYLDKKQNIIYGDEKFYFKDFNEFKEKLSEDYGIDFSKVRKQKMYADTKSGETKEVGYVISTWDTYGDTGQRFPKEIWISFIEEKSVDLSAVKKRASKKDLKRMV